jgi:hypothetical protein
MRQLYWKSRVFQQFPWLEFVPASGIVSATHLPPMLTVGRLERHEELAQER